MKGKLDKSLQEIFRIVLKYFIKSAMQELEDDYEQRLADRVRQLEEKADESRRAAREHAEEIRQVQ